MERKLVTIRKVRDISPIPGADFIETATVDGWNLIIKKGEFEVDGLGVYFEIDSVLPMDDRYQFLKKVTVTSGGEGYRLKTMKMRGTISQGLLLPMSMFPELEGKEFGDDVTDDLGVWLYEPKYSARNPNSNGEQKTRYFPPFLRKTDEARIQNHMNYFDLYKGQLWEASLKLDGSSCTIWNYDKAPYVKQGKSNKFFVSLYYGVREWIKAKFANPDTFGVCSRNINLREKEGNAFWDIANELSMRTILSGHNVALQGELIGPNIQRNHEKVDKNEFHLFAIFDMDKQEYLLPHERTEWLFNNDPLDIIKHVPIHGLVDIFETCEDVAAMQEFVEGESMNPGTISEGMVFKSVTQRGQSFKCISNKYLLKCED